MSYLNITYSRQWLCLPLFALRVVTYATLQMYAIIVKVKNTTSELKAILN